MERVLGDDEWVQALRECRLIELAWLVSALSVQVTNHVISSCCEKYQLLLAFIGIPLECSSAVDSLNEDSVRQPTKRRLDE